MPHEAGTRRAQARRPWRQQMLRRGMGLLDRLAPALAAWVAERLWFTPPRLPRRVVRAERAAVPGLSWFELTVAGCPRPGFVTGQGPLVLLVHGWGGRAAQLGSLAARLAQVGFRAAALELPGHGDDRRRRSDPFQMAEGVRALRDLLGEPTAVVAHSLGAFVAVVALADRPPPAVVLLAPGLAARPFIERFGGLLGLSEEGSARLEERLRRFAGDLWPVVSAGPDLDMPGTRLLVVHDPADPDTPYETSAALAARRPETRLLEAPGSGHRRLLQEDWVLDEVVQFLQHAVAGATSRERGDAP